MNIRIDNSNIRFRLTPADYSSLVSGKGVTQKIFVGTGLSFSVYPDAQNGTQLGVNADGMILHVGEDALRALGDMGRSKYGLSFTQDGIEISLQIDLKLQKPKAA